MKYTYRKKKYWSKCIICIDGNIGSILCAIKYIAQNGIC